MILATTIILIIILISACILVVPFEICIDLSIQGFKFEGYLKITWMKIKLIKREFQQDKTEKDIKQEEKAGEKGQKLNLKKIIKIISLLWESLPHIIKIFKAILKSVKIEQINLHAIIGIGSPVDTVVICGYLWSLTSFTGIFQNTSLSVEPDFQKERIDGRIILKIKLRLFWIVIESLRALTKRPVRSLFNEIRKMR